MTTRIAPMPPQVASARPSPVPGSSAPAFEATRAAVQRLLTAIPTFPDLSDEERARMAKATVQVLAFMADPNGVYSEVAAREARGELPVGTLPADVAPPAVPARALADPVEDTKKSLSRSPGFAGKDFAAGATAQGVEQFGALVQKVDFPAFVGGLIKNVFQAIVDSSIQQMRAYGELIANVAKTTDQFMRDNIGEAAGRDFLAESYPDVFEIDSGQTSDSFAGDDDTAPPETAPAPVLRTVGDDAAVRLAEISRNLNLTPPVSDISDANAELRLVTAARLQMAKSRQQLLSSMVMLGINRIVVTDGSINAKVIFDMRASDKAKRDYKAQMNDRSAQMAKASTKAEYGSWFSPVSAEFSSEASTEHVATVGSAVDETSESKAEVKAKLSGEVRVNFKSDYLPLEKMATPGMMSVIQGNSTPYNPNEGGNRRRTRTLSMGRFIPPPPDGARIVPRSDAAVAAALALGMRLAERAAGPGLAFALDELGDIELPEPAAARIDRAQLRALASLYLAADLEPAGIITSAESLAGLSASGALQINLGAAEPLAAQWWRKRHERMSDEERNAFFARLFGTSSGPIAAEASRNVRFEDRMLELAEALVKLDEAGGLDAAGSTMAQTRVRSAARNLAQNLGDASGGMTAFIATELMATLKDAFALIGHPALRGAFQARDIWDVVRGIARLGHARTGEAQPYVRRGKAGMIVLAWLADVLDSLGGATPLVRLGDPVISAAVDWLEATLTLGEAGSDAPPPAVTETADRPASVWSALAG